MNMELSTKEKNKNKWNMYFQEKKMTERDDYVLFPLCNLFGWNKQGYNGYIIKNHAI